MKYTFRHIHFLLAFACLMTGIGGCTKDGTEIPVFDSNDVRVRLQMSIPGTRGGLNSGFDECAIGSIDILSFEKGVFRYAAKAYNIDPSGKFFNVVLQKDMDIDGQKLYILANLSDEIADLSLTVGETTMAQVQERLKFNIAHRRQINSVVDNASEFGVGRLLPMWGEQTVFLLRDDMEMGPIFMLRSVAKATVQVDEALVMSGFFKVKDVVVYNAPDKGFAIPKSTHYTMEQALDENWEPYYFPKATLPEKPSDAAEGKAYYSCTDGEGIINRIYLGEKSNDAAIAGSLDDDEKTCLVISGYYDGDNTESWYRVPFKDINGDPHDVLRNHEYIFLIKNVSGPGSSTEEGAVEGKIEAEVVEWNIGLDYELQLDGTNYLYVEKRKVTLPDGNGSYSLVVETNNPSWTTELTYEGNQTAWLTPAWNIGSSQNGTKTLTLSHSGNVSANERKAYLNIKAGRLTVTVEFDQYGFSFAFPSDNLSWQNAEVGVTVNGSWPDMSFRAVTGAAIISKQIKSLAAGSGTSAIQKVELADNSVWDNPRVVKIEYSTDGTVWNAIPTQPEKKQLSWVTPQITLDKNKIDQDGENVTVANSGGTFPNGYIEVRRSLLYYTNAEINPQTQQINNGIPVVFSINANNTGQERTVTFEYRRKNSDATWSGWTIIGSAMSQPVGNFILSTGRIVAKNNVMLNGNTGEEKMTWAEAMGISTTNPNYNETLFNNPQNYTPTTTTGCGGYSEPGYGAGKWRLPTLQELQEIYNMRESIGHTTTTRHWSSTENSATRADYVFFLAGDLDWGSKHLKFWARCVRDR